MTDVFVVTQIPYKKFADEELVAVFSTREKAIAFCEARHAEILWRVFTPTEGEPYDFGVVMHDADRTSPALTCYVTKCALDPESETGDDR